jgi:cob(I)alamin adenosyltransferase
MKIYTKSGDKGKTSLIGGTRVLKNDKRIEAYGTLDELNSFLGLLRNDIESEDLNLFILNVQRFLFKVGAYLATDFSKVEIILKQEDIKPQILILEKKIDEIEERLPKLSNFIVPGGKNGAAVCHICRTVTRRLERRLLDAEITHPVNMEVLIYVNRLSDFLFVLGRFFAFNNNEEVFL